MSYSCAMRLLGLIVCACAWTISTDASVVVTSSGPVRGKLIFDHGVSYYAYQAIPYAESPTGDLRFKPPVPKRPWREILDASRTGPVCPQAEGQVSRANMSEDCLNVNVLVPANKTQQSMPVLVYVHGGVFESNSGNINGDYGPQLFLNRGIIYVSMNFRLGALGYLSLGTEKASGNAGLKDLLLALQWIRSNIHFFGGSTITIGGQSSGAAMAHYMMLTDKSKGLFDRAMLNGGSATNFRSLSRHPRRYALALANELGIPNKSDELILQNLRKADVFDIIEAHKKIDKSTRNVMSPFVPFIPCIEKESEHSILTRNPIEIIKGGIPHNVPVLAGFNSLEGAFLWPALHSTPVTTLQEQYSLSIPRDIEYPIDSDMYKNLVASIGEFYFGDINFSNWTLTNFYNLLSDTQYIYSVGSWIKLHKERKTSANLYYYLFNFDGELNWSKINFNISFPGTVHADEIGYLFVNQVTNDRLKNLDQRSQQTLNNTMSLVSNFIKYGNPTPAGSVSGLEWPEHGGQGRHLLINAQPAPVPQAPFAHRFAFWDNVYNQYYEYVKNGILQANKLYH